MLSAILKQRRHKRLSFTISRIHMQPTTRTQSSLVRVQLRFIPDNNENLHFNLLLYICEMHFLRKKRVKDRHSWGRFGIWTESSSIFIFLYLLVLRRFFVSLHKNNKSSEKRAKIVSVLTRRQFSWLKCAFCVWLQLRILENPRNSECQTKTIAGDLRRVSDNPRE